MKRYIFEVRRHFGTGKVEDDRIRGGVFYYPKSKVFTDKDFESLGHKSHYYYRHKIGKYIELTPKEVFFLMNKLYWHRNIKDRIRDYLDRGKQLYGFMSDAGGFSIAVHKTNTSNVEQSYRRISGDVIHPSKIFQVEKDQ